MACTDAARAQCRAARCRVRRPRTRRPRTRRSRRGGRGPSGRGRSGTPRSRPPARDCRGRHRRSRRRRRGRTGRGRGPSGPGAAGAPGGRRRSRAGPVDPARPACGSGRISGTGAPDPIGARARGGAPGAAHQGRAAEPPGRAGDRQPEGRRRQDHDRGEPGRGARRAGSTGCSWSTSTPRATPRTGLGINSREIDASIYDVHDRRHPARGLRRAHEPQEPLRRPVDHRPRRRRDRAGARVQPRAQAPAGDRRASATTTTSSSSTARRRSGC